MAVLLLLDRHEVWLAEQLGLLNARLAVDATHVIIHRHLVCVVVDTEHLAWARCNPLFTHEQEDRREID